MAEREAYPNAPLRLVSLELRFPLTSRMLLRPVWDAFEKALSAELPVVKILASDPDSHVPRDAYDPVLRMVSETQQRAVTLYHGALTVELADYRSFGDLRDLTSATLQALDAVPGGLNCTRIGLRYINEIRSSLLHEDEDAWARREEWIPYINEDLLDRPRSLPAANLEYIGGRGRFVFRSTDADFIGIDYAALPGSVVEPTDVLLLDDESGPCFVLDIDAYRSGTKTSPVAATCEAALSVLSRLHGAVESAFDWSITDKLRGVFHVVNDEAVANPRTLLHSG
jgi:uncharacterized protein (TIGR04255 family)